MFRNVYIYLLIAISAIVSGCVIQPINGASSGMVSPVIAEPGDVGVPPDAVAEGPFAAYTLKPMDPLFIRFSGIQELQSLDVVIDENGEINLLHIPNAVMAAGLTTSQLEDKIEQLYIDGGIYKTVSVNVTMTAKVYYVQGEVMQPGLFQLSSGTTLLQAIAGARGYTQFANPKKVTVTRQGKIYQFNMKAIENDPSKDVKIEAGDVIKVWQSWY